METRAAVFDLELARPFGIARETRSVQRTFIVSLSQDGFTGYGEATENAYYDVTVEKLKAGWEALRPYLKRTHLTRPEELWEELKKRTENFRFLMAAVDEAAWDLYGKMHGFRHIDRLFPGWNQVPVSSYTIGLDDIEVMKAKILEKPWPIYKIKLGTPHDEEIVRELRSVTDRPFRVDANAAWTYEKAKDLIPKLAELNVELVEQPLAADNYRDTARLKEISPLPLIADEACRTEEDLPRAFEAYHGINVKLTKAGGMTPAKEMWARAARAGRLRMVGCMTESSVGISAAAQFLPAVQYADLDGALLLKRDIARGVEITPRGARFPDRPGNGVELLVNL
ncbi:MAG: dipeptide epimerase [Chlorobi bacterium]|nr:dipeptide epimerase [Chlorobiota bacterium]